MAAEADRIRKLGHRHNSVLLKTLSKGWVRDKFAGIWLVDFLGKGLACRVLRFLRKPLGFHFWLTCSLGSEEGPFHWNTFIPVRAIRQNILAESEFNEDLVGDMNFFEELRRAGANLGLRLDKEYAYQGGNPTMVRSRLPESEDGPLGKLESSLLIFILGSLLYGPVRASEGAQEDTAKKFQQGGVEMIQKAAEAFNFLERSETIRGKGFTTNAMLAAVPELSVTMSVLNPDRPLPALLQLCLKDKNRKSLEDFLDETIGRDSTAKEVSETAAKTAKKLQRSARMGSVEKPLEGGFHFCKVIEEVSVILEEPAHVKGGSRLGAVVDWFAQEPMDVFSAIRDGTFLDKANGLKIPATEEEAPKVGTSGSSKINAKKK